MYLAFDNTNLAWSAVNDLGRYGIFNINGNIYNNLSNKAAATDPGQVGSFSGTFCGGTAPSRVGYNYLPHVIFLGTWAAGQSASFDIAFNFHACMTAGGGSALWGSVANDFNPALAANLPLNFKIAAFQQGVNPNDPYNGAGQIAPLTLPIANYAAGTQQ